MRHGWASRKGNRVRVRTNSFPSFDKYCLWLCKKEKKRGKRKISMWLGPREMQSGDFTLVLTRVLTYSLILKSTRSNWFPSPLSELVHMLWASNTAEDLSVCSYWLTQYLASMDSAVRVKICFSPLFGPRSHCSLGSMTSDSHICSLRLWETLLSFQYIGNLDLLYSSRVNQLLVLRARK